MLASCYFPWILLGISNRLKCIKSFQFQLKFSYNRGLFLIFNSKNIIATRCKWSKKNKQHTKPIELYNLAWCRVFAPIFFLCNSTSPFQLQRVYYIGMAMKCHRVCTMCHCAVRCSLIHSIASAKNI